MLLFFVSIDQPRINRRTTVEIHKWLSPKCTVYPTVQDMGIRVFRKKKKLGVAIVLTFKLATRA